MKFKEKLYRKSYEMGIVLDDQQLDCFELYYHMLLEKNKVMNLTSITDEDQVIDKHFIDSLTCVRIIDPDKMQNVIDVGTGAGFPGIPLKIAYPDIRLTLLDSLQKRISFLDELVDKTGLKNVKTVHGRAEDLARDVDYRAAYDLCLSRAVANLSTLSEYCIPFLKVGGYFVSYKSKKGYDEISQADHCMKVLGCKIDKTEEFHLSDQESDRLLIKIKKIKDTSKKYPRKAGIPSRNPL